MKTILDILFSVGVASLFYKLLAWAVEKDYAALYFIMMTIVIILVAIMGLLYLKTYGLTAPVIFGAVIGVMASVLKSKN